MPTQPLNKADMDQVARGGCGNPDCTHYHEFDEPFFMHPRCHPDGRLSVSYVGGSGELTVCCGQCEKFICKIKVADD